MGSDAVSLEVLVREAVVGAFGGLFPRARDARYGISHNRTIPKQAGPDSRSSRKRGCRGIASRATYENGLALASALGKRLEIGAEQLGQAECGLRQQIGCRMLDLIPLFVYGWVFQAEIS